MRIAKITIAVIAVFILLGFGTLAYKGGTEVKHVDFGVPKLQSSEDKLQDKLQNVNVKLEKVNTDFINKSSTDQKTIDEQNEQMRNLEKEREDLKNQVQAKAEEKRKIAEAAANAVNTLTATQTAEAAPAPTPVYDGSNESMMAAAGIAASDYAAVDYIVHHESTWNTTAVNPSSGSCGLVQELPCGKSGCTFGDGVCQLQWATQYATSRYGSWWGAYDFWVANRWW